MKLVIEKVRVVTPDKVIPSGFVYVVLGKIEEIGEGPCPRKYKNSADKVIDGHGNFLIPGLVDIHFHGIGEYDFNNNHLRAIANASRKLIKEGVTCFVPTLVMDEREKLLGTLENLSEAIISFKEVFGAKPLGIYLEGPFINEAKAGILPKEYALLPDIELMKEFVYASKGMLKIVSLAPELDDAMELIDLMRKNDVIPALGHTMASYEVTLKAIERGLMHISHTFNAMGSFHHRNPGAIGAVLTSKDITAEIIADGVHIHPAVVSFFCNLKELEKIILITDKILGLEEKGMKGRFCGKIVESDGYSVRSLEGTLVGSVTPLVKALGNLIDYTSLSLTEAVKLCSINPLRLFGLDEEKGSLEVGKDADMVLIDEEFNVLSVIVEGKEVLEGGEG